MSTPADRNYTNDRREGRTQPGLIEYRSIFDTPRLAGTQYASNRVSQRFAGNRPGTHRIKRHSPRATPAIDHPLNTLRLRARAAITAQLTQQATDRKEAA